MNPINIFFVVMILIGCLLWGLCILLDHKLKEMTEDDADKPESRDCGNCRHMYSGGNTSPCSDCFIDPVLPRWEPRI